MRTERMPRWYLSCNHCGQETTIHVLGDTYGRLLGRTTEGEIALCDCIQDPVCEEVKEFVDVMLKTPNRAECFQRVLGEACDPAPSGETFRFDGRFHCPNCHQLVSHYRESNPLMVDTIELAFVTHVQWQELSKAQKEERLQNALKSADCMV